MYKIMDIINNLFKKGEEVILDDRFEFRLNSKEKILIKKYCELKHIDPSKFLRNLAIREIDNFIQINR